MPKPLVLPISAGIILNGNKLTDHNRAAINVSYEKVEYRKRMGDGTMRRLTVAEKRTWKVGWSTLPGATNKTVDGFWGAIAIRDFYVANRGDVTMTLTDGKNATETFKAMFTDFSMKIVKRGSYVDFYDVDFSLEEI